jgi:putative methionine-R-sulfoxide reductase with GAF domain
MKTWFSNFTKDTSPLGIKVIYIALLFILSAMLSIPLNYFAYLQTGAWQIFASMISLTILAIVSSYALNLARKNQVTLAAGVLIGIACLFIPFNSVLISGLGLVLGLSLFLTNAAIAGQTLEGRPAFIALIAALIFSLLAIFIDLFASWERLAVPVLTNFIPLIALAIVGILIFVTVRQFPTYSLRTKLIAVVLSIAVISIGTVSFVTNVSVTSQLNQTAKENLTIVADTTSDQIAERLLQNIDRLNILALNKFVQDNTESGFNTATNNLLVAELTELQGSYSNFTEILIADTSGKLISSTNINSAFNQSDQLWWQTTWNDGAGATYVSEPFFDETTQNYVVQIAIPMPAHNEERLVGVVAAKVNMREFADILSKNQADILFVNSQIMSHESVGLIQTLDAQDLSALSTLTAENFEEIMYENELSFIRTADLTSPNQAIQNLNWTIIVQQNVEVVRAPIESATRTLFLTAIVLLLVVVFVAFLIGNQFLRPIETLTAAAKKLAEGDFTAKANVTVTDEIGTLANSFNTMSSQVNDLITTLEQRVSDRTKALSTSTEVSRRLSTILDEKQLVTEVVNQVQNAFNYYHVHIYLMDNKQEKLIMAGGTGEAGQVMLKRGHFISVGKGLVGRAGETNAPILVSDTVNNPDWLPNPLLPDTKSEIAVPISLANQVVGVLDVQQNIVDGLKREDVDLLQSIANQAAIALQNSRTLLSAQERASREQLIASINQKILSENNVESALQVAVREIGRALDTRTAIRLNTGNISKNTNTVMKEGTS